MGIRIKPPDRGPGPHHRKVVATKPVAGTRAGHWLQLECGHIVQSFGDLKHLDALGGRVLCAECRSAVQREKPDA